MTFEKDYFDIYNPFSILRLRDSLYINKDVQKLYEEGKSNPLKKYLWIKPAMERENVLNTNKFEIFLNRYLDEINEAHHLYLPHASSDYRKLLDKITKDVINDKGVLLNVFTMGPKCKVYTYDLSNIIANIKILKVFVQFNDKDNVLEAQALNTNDVNDFFIKPVFIKKNNIIERIGMILYLKDKIYDTFNENTLIRNMIYHEMKHILDTAWNDKLILHACKDNDILEILRQTYGVSIFGNTCDIMLPMYEQWDLSEFVLFIENCIYYTLKTEMGAYVESAILEIKENFIKSKISEFELLHNLKTYCCKFSDVYNGIYILLYFLNNFIYSYEKQLKDPFEYMSDEVLDIIAILKNKEIEVKKNPANQYKLLPYLKKWKHNLLKFSDNVKSAVKKEINNSNN